MITPMNNASRNEKALFGRAEGGAPLSKSARVAFQTRRATAQNMASDDFEQMVARHYEPLFKFAFSLTRVESEALDLTQHAFYVWATKAHQLRDQSKAKAWLFSTLHRAFLATRRTYTRFPHHALEEVPIHDLPECAPDFANTVDSHQVLAALAKVDAVYQAALALFYLEDCSYLQIAQILEVPMGTVKSRIARGIGQLRQLFGFPASERPNVAGRSAEKRPNALAWPAALGYQKVNPRSVPCITVNHSLEPLLG